MDKFELETFTSLLSENSAFQMIETCQLCGRASHETKSMRDQCRLFTAILGRGWGVMRHLGEKSCSDSESEEDMFITPDTSFSEE